VWRTDEISQRLTESFGQLGWNFCQAARRVLNVQAYWTVGSVTADFEEEKDADDDAAHAAGHSLKAAVNYKKPRVDSACRIGMNLKEDAVARARARGVVIQTRMGRSDESAAEFRKKLVIQVRR
jgi:hypothetical protein